MEFPPIATLQEVELLDLDEVVEGYRAGAAGWPEPVASYFSRSFQHGWRNGASAAGLIPRSVEQRLLEHAFELAHAASLRASGIDFGANVPLPLQ